MLWSSAFFEDGLKCFSYSFTLSFKGFFYPYILNTSITISRYLYPLFHLLKLCISTRSTLHISSMWSTIICRRVKLLFMDLCNSSASCCCQLISLLNSFFWFLKHLNQAIGFLLIISCQPMTLLTFFIGYIIESFHRFSICFILVISSFSTTALTMKFWVVFAESLYLKFSCLESLVTFLLGKTDQIY